MRLGCLGVATPGRVAFDLGLREPQRRVFGDDERVQADAARRHREVTEGGVLVGKREVLAGMEPVARDDQAHRRLMCADQCPRQLAGRLQSRVDAAFELHLRAFGAHNHDQPALESVTR
jgi:hypothetical protein